MSCGDKKETTAPQPPFLLSESKNTTPTYAEGIAFWQEMADAYDEIEMFRYGITDAGYPLHVVIVDGERPRPIGAYKTGMKQLLLINNAIHPGEPDGVDASMLLAHELMTNPKAKGLLKNTSVAIIPFYNIGGALNRNAHSRTNQNGPEEYGFRGNAQNLDLNRDFVKCDSRNARTFATLINELDPDLYIETHVSNGADYQHVLTYLSTQEDKMGGQLGEKLRNEWTPFITKRVGKAGFQPTPYVNLFGTSPRDGFGTFYDQPRYSTGYLALLGIPGYITETHMLKPYKQRVESTFEFLMAGVDLLAQHSVRKIIDEDRLARKKQMDFPIDWEVDSTMVKAQVFLGYEAGYKTSDVSGQPRLYYDRSKPYSTKVPYYYGMKAIKTVTAPKYYVLPQGYVDVVERLRAAGVKLMPFESDTTIKLEVYRIDSLSTITSPYEKHYYHYNTHVSKTVKDVQLFKGDFLIPLDNKHRRFLVEVLEPEGPDSYFNWNFFDAVLQQKEWYSPYVFEDEAAEILKNDKALKAAFDARKEASPDFAGSARAQLYWVYTHSKRYEKEHMRYPVYRGL